MAFTNGIGYNVKEVNDMMEKIERAYGVLASRIKLSWDDLRTMMQREWIGEDEQDYETRLAGRINELYRNTGSLAKTTIRTISGLAEQWHKYQVMNTISGNASKYDAGIDLRTPDIVVKDYIVAPKQITFASDMDRGLRNTNSGNLIKDGVNNFIVEIKNECERLFSAITAKKAFFGEQVVSINKYIERASVAFSNLTVEVKEMSTVIDRLTLNSYNRAQTQFTENLGPNTLNTGVSSSKWDA